MIGRENKTIRRKRIERDGKRKKMEKKQRERIEEMKKERRKIVHLFRSS